MVEFDDSAWPVTRVSIRGKLEDGELQPLLDHMTSWIDRGSEVTVLDLSENRGVDVRHLRRMSQWLNEHRAVLNERGSATVMVLGNGFMRASADFVLKLAPGAGRFHVAKSVSDALELAQTLRAAKA